MAKSNSEIIGDGFSDGDIKYREGEVASGTTIYPGMVLEVNGTTSGPGNKYTLQPIQSADEIGRTFRIALTPRSPPKGADSDVPIEHEYSAGENLQYAIVRSGIEIQNALLGNGDNVSFDDLLGSNNDGSLGPTSTGGSGLARAREDLDNGGGSDQGGISAARIRVEVI